MQNYCLYLKTKELKGEEIISQLINSPVRNITQPVLCGSNAHHHCSVILSLIYIYIKYM